MPNLELRAAKNNLSIFSDSIRNDALIYVTNPSQVIRLGSDKTATEGSPQPSTLTIDASTIAPKVTFDSTVDMNDPLNVKNDVILSGGGSLGIGIGASNLSALSNSSELRVNGNMVAQGGDVSLTLSNIETVRLSTTIKTAEEVPTGNAMKFTRNNGSSFELSINPGGGVLDDDVPPLGTLIWVMSASEENDPTASSSYVVADGSEVDKTEYPDLFDIFGNSYGQSTNSNLFKLPKLIGYSLSNDDLKVRVETEYTVGSNGEITEQSTELRVLPLILAKRNNGT